MVGVSKAEINKIADEWADALCELVAGFPDQVDLLVTVRRRDKPSGPVDEPSTRSPRPAIRQLSPITHTSDEVTVYENALMSSPTSVSEKKR